MGAGDSGDAAGNSECSVQPAHRRRVRMARQGVIEKNRSRRRPGPILTTHDPLTNGSRPSPRPKFLIFVKAMPNRLLPGSASCAQVEAAAPGALRLLAR